MTDADAAAPGPAAPPIERRPAALASPAPDAVVIGGGIHGAWVALDAAQRGLRVVLVEQDDFFAATSGNSQRIIHGGLRYLQHGHVPRVRESIRERRALLHLAPHLVRPMPCLVPTYGLGSRSRAALAAALALHDLIGFDRNRGLDPARRVPPGRLVGRRRCLELFDGFDRRGLTGGAVFWDAAVLDSERLGLAILRSAVAAGARAANHVRAVRLLTREGAVGGVELEDRLTGCRFDLPARAVVSCTGPWTARTLGLEGAVGHDAALARRFPVFRAAVLVTRPLVGETAVALAGRPGYRDEDEWLAKGYRNYFITPWRGHSLVGTFYAPFEGDPSELRVTRDELQRWVGEFGEICPAAGLRLDDVRHVFAGLLPRGPGGRSDDPQYAKRHAIVDHGAEGGSHGWLTVVGVKWTTARDVARRAVDRLLRVLGRPAVGCSTASRPLHGGEMSDPEAYLHQAARHAPPGLEGESLAHLVLAYGTAWPEVAGCAEGGGELLLPLGPGRVEIGAEVLYAVRFEAARTLPDVVFRRTGIGATGPPARDTLARCARLMAGELGWDDAETGRQLDAVDEVYLRVGITP